MSIRSCVECKGPVSTMANYCPNCGAKWPTVGAGGRIFFTVFVVLPLTVAGAAFAAVIVERFLR